MRLLKCVGCRAELRFTLKANILHFWFVFGLREFSDKLAPSIQTTGSCSNRSNHKEVFDAVPALQSISCSNSQQSSRNNLATRRFYAFFPHNCWLHHIQYGRQFSRNVNRETVWACMASLYMKYIIVLCLHALCQALVCCNF